MKRDGGKTYKAYRFRLYPDKEQEELLGRTFGCCRFIYDRMLADKIEDLAINGKSSIVFIIGGSLGLSAEVSKRSNFKLSFSAMTFPHQMMRVILLEQIYRAFKIIRHEAYHK